MRPFQYIFILLLVIPTVARAQTSADSSRKPVFKALPTAYYTPETRIAVEAFAYFSFYADSADRRSNVRLFAAVTQNRQLTIDLPWQVFTKRESFRIDGKFDIRKFPEYYYGLGNETVEKQRQLYEYWGFGLINRAHKKLKGNHYAGMLMEARWLRTDNLPAFPMTGTELRGDQGYQFAGAGPSYIYDSRDVILCATRGKFIELAMTMNAVQFPKSSNAVSSFYKIYADYRQFFSVTPSTVLAYEVVAQSALGRVPYRELPALGGPLLHRGYYFGRYRDKNMACVQLEVRQHLFWRFGAVAYGSAGRVYDDFDQPLLQNIRPAGGGGIRFKLSKKDEANLRFDVAFTPDSHGFYLYFAEAF